MTSHKTAVKEANFQLPLKSQHLHHSMRKLAVYKCQNNMAGGGGKKKALSEPWILLYIVLNNFIFSSEYFFLLVFTIIYIGVIKFFKGDGLVVGLPSRGPRVL